MGTYTCGGDVHRSIGGSYRFWKWYIIFYMNDDEYNNN